MAKLWKNWGIKRRYKMNRFLKRVTSWLFWLNFLYFQWFFVRLGKKYSYRQKEFLGWEFIGFMFPLTGWWGRYFWVWKLKTVRTNKSLSKEDIRKIQGEEK